MLGEAFAPNVHEPDLRIAVGVPEDCPGPAHEK